MLQDAIDPGFVRAHLVTFVDAYGPPEHAGEPDRSEVDRNVLERLRSLGYIN